MNKCEYCQLLKSVDDSRLIYEGKYWQVALSTDQQYLGKSFVTLNRHAESLHQLDQDEILEFLDIVKKFENSVNSAFEPTHFNWSCLMNYSAGTHTPFHVHWHAIPRYKDSRKVAGQEFKDSRWPKSARTMEPNAPATAALSTITNKIKTSF